MSNEHVEHSAATHCYAGAETINKTMMVDVDVLADRFWVRDNAGDDAQVRLEPNGKVYLCYTKDNRRTIESREISWPDFVAVFRRFVDEFKA
jgi:hypothetical protein